MLTGTSADEKISKAGSRVLVANAVHSATKVIHCSRGRRTAGITDHPM